MGVEIERKFRVRAGWRPDSAGEEIAQGYLSSVPERTVRVRLRGGRGYLTVKGKNGGAPAADARALLALAEPGVIEKERCLVPAADGHTWEVDVFHGENEGLVVAEIELGAEDEPFARPDWLADEVTGDARYYNSSLTRTPYRLWEER
ncbi:CYTH domain-containing protein [uncultured Selenomonas sp.]|uniref:CYTH domain-containing protein n=1 Tax=uncultured Selenomonas sp. TaxID=159275 RepID=UPI00258D3F1F|nr:CYTH domain-containing protein [uncultured Selenomonas sp.]